jgi:hypothetical protein
MRHSLYHRSARRNVALWLWFQSAVRDRSRGDVGARFLPAVMICILIWGSLSCRTRVCTDAVLTDVPGQLARLENRSTAEAGVLRMLINTPGYREYSGIVCGMYEAGENFISVLCEYHGAFGAICLLRKTRNWYVIALPVQRRDKREATIIKGPLPNAEVIGVWDAFDGASWRHWLGYEYFGRRQEVTSEAPIYFSVKRGECVRFHCVSGAYPDEYRRLVDAAAGLVGRAEYYGRYGGLAELERESERRP